MQSWGGKPYFPISHVYREKFGSKTIKIPVAVSETCPNREGIRGMQTCIFCDEHGSFAYPETQSQDLRTQIETHRARIRERFNAHQFLVYFQAYTTTFSVLKKLTDGFQTALSYDDVAGIVVGTRPDTLSDAFLRACVEVNQSRYLGVELGVQSFDDDQLIWMRRGHTASQSIKGVERVAAAGLDVGIHLMFGWPTENDKQIIETARLCNDLPISNVKLHNLHVLTKTPLADLYREGKFEPISLEAYADRVALFLDHLSPKIAVHRLVALSSKWDELVAPEWTRHKMKTFQAVLDRVNERGSWQGRLVEA